MSLVIIAGGIAGAGSANYAGVDAQGNLLVSNGGTSKTVIAAATVANTTIKASAGRLCKIIVTATGTNPMVFQDNGVTVAGLPASPAIGTVLDVQIPCGTNIVAVGNAANPGVTVTFS